MKIHRLDTEILLPRPRDEVFRFFADAANLEVLTPAWLKFSLVTRPPVEMKAGTRLEYRLRVHGFPLRWVSEITAWEPPGYFADEQRRGPYRLWAHEHFFEERQGGTVARDRVRYAVPGGAIVNRLFVRRDLERIFAYRQRKMLEIFGPRNNDSELPAFEGEKTDPSASSG